MKHAVELIVNADVLAERVAGWTAAPWLALDTEFLREDTYHPKLCLIQVSDGRSEACLDAQALSAGALAPFWALLAAPDQAKVFHAASQDLEIMVRQSQRIVQPLFDTQIAAALLGYGDQLGYAALVEKMLGVKLDKTLTRTDWSRRPLSPAELAYAAADVSHLAEIHPRLTEGLSARGRLPWLQEDCARMADVERYRNPPETAWKRLKGLARLAPAMQPAAIALAAWREQVAQERDRPRKWIIDDDALYRIAERRPQSFDELKALQVLPPKTLERHGAAILAAVMQARDLQMPAAAQELPLSESAKALMKKLQEGLRQIAEQLEIPASLIAPRADVEALVRYGADAEAGVLVGWRRDIAGAALLRLL